MADKAPRNRDLIPDPDCTCGKNPRRQCPVHHQAKAALDREQKKAKDYAEKHGGSAK